MPLTITWHFAGKTFNTEQECNDYRDFYYEHKDLLDLLEEDNG